MILEGIERSWGGCANTGVQVVKKANNKNHKVIYVRHNQMLIKESKRRVIPKPKTRRGTLLSCGCVDCSNHKPTAHQVLSELHQCMHDGEHLFVINGVEPLQLHKFPYIKSYQVSILHKNCPYANTRSVALKYKGLMVVPTPDKCLSPL